jgi:transposase
MQALSMDFRERIVSAYENKEGSQSELAKRFSVGKSTVGKLVRQKRELGTLEPQVHRCGRKPAIQGEKLEELREHLAEHPDATLEERIEALGLDCVVNTMWTTLRRLGVRYKKSLRERSSKIAQM